MVGTGSIESKVLSGRRIERLISPLNNLPIRKRIILTSLTVNLVMIVVAAVVVTIAAYRNIIRQSTFVIRRNFDQAASYINSTVNSSKNISDTIILNAYVNDIINGTYEDSVAMTAAWRSLKGILQSTEYYEEVHHASVYVDDRWDSVIDGYIVRPLSDLTEDPVFWDLLNQNTFIQFTEGNADYLDESRSAYISFYKSMRSVNDYNRISFILRLDLPRSDFQSILFNSKPSNDSLSFLINRSGQIIVASDRVPDVFLSQECRQYYENDDNGTLRTVRIDGDRYVLVHEDISYTDWDLVTLIPYSSYLLNSTRTVSIILAISVIVVLITVVLFSIISETISKRILALSEVIKKGDLTKLNAPDYRDEIGLLCRSYDGMIDRIENLLVENYNMGRDLRSAEYEALQSQINPHFLYNTLDMISWFSVQGKAREINKVVYSLAKFYKISLSKGRNVISIEEELQHVNCYITIQQYRFKDKIDYIEDIDPEILKYSIPKITIQPIVENAIFHGILENSKGPGGTVTITGRLEDNTVHIAVSDDGKGMDVPKLFSTGKDAGKSSSKEASESSDAGKKDDNGAGSSSGSSYGLKNIIMRLQLLYGEDYGLSIESERGTGCTVHINIPRLRPEEAEKGMLNHVTVPYEE